MTADLGQAWSDEIVTRSSEWLTPADVAAYREMPAFENTQSFPVASVQARAFGPNGVTANQNTFERKDVVIEVANAAPQGVGPWLADIDGVVDAVMASDQVVDVRTEKLREKKTTVELLEHEQRIIEVAVEGLADGRAILDAATIEQGLENFYAGEAGVESLNEDQLSVLHAVAADGNAISSIEALAGSGKTTTAGAMREVFEAGGYRAFAAGPTGRAVRELASAGFERPRTLSAWEVKFEIMGPREAIRRTFGDPSRAVLFVDETGMADTRLLSKITTEMADAGVKVVLIGDSYQLTSVRAGGMHAALSAPARRLQALATSAGSSTGWRSTRWRSCATARRARIWRSSSTRLRATWRSGSPARRSSTRRRARRRSRSSPRAGLRRGRTVPTLRCSPARRPTRRRWRRRSATSWRCASTCLTVRSRRRSRVAPTPLAHARGMNSLALVTKDNARRAALNRMIREQLTEQGVLTGHTTMGRFEDEDLEWAVGDRVIARRNHKGYDLDNGTLGTIIELDESGMTLADDNGNTRRFNADDPEHVAYVSEHLEHAYALTAHGTQGATLAVGRCGRPAGRVLARVGVHVAVARQAADARLRGLRAHAGRGGAQGVRDRHGRRDRPREGDRADGGADGQARHRGGGAAAARARRAS